MGRHSIYPPELRERAVRLVSQAKQDHRSEWAAIVAVSSQLGISTEALRTWIRRSEIDEGSRSGVTTSQAEELRRLRRENAELKRANEILKAASVFFARELDPRLPK